MTKVQTTADKRDAYFTVFGDGIAELRVSIDCCVDCDDEHRIGCEYTAALSTLPAGAVLDSIGYDDAGDLLTLTW